MFNPWLVSLRIRRLIFYFILNEVSDNYVIGKVSVQQREKVVLNIYHYPNNFSKYLKQTVKRFKFILIYCIKTVHQGLLRSIPPLMIAR